MDEELKNDLQAQEPEKEVVSVDDNLKAQVFNRDVTASDMEESFKKATIVHAGADEKTFKKGVEIESERLLNKSESTLEAEKHLNNANTIESELTEAGMYFQAHKEVLKFMRINQDINDTASSGHSLGFLKTMFWIGIWLYTIISILKGIGMFIGELISVFDIVFTAMCGSVTRVKYDEQGNEIAKEYKLNTVTKIILWFAFILVIIVVALALLNKFTGIDVYEIVRSYFAEKIK